ncbi:hypothetical protein AAG906_008991 [Vitis piasezkii]
MEELLGQVKSSFFYTKASQQKEKSKEKQREAKRSKRSKEENRGQQLQSSLALLEHFRSPFSTFYIPFQSSRSQESNGSNRVRFGAEMRKLWPSEDNCSSYLLELLEGEVFNSKFCINPLEPISMAIESRNQMAPFLEGATSTMKQPLRVTCDLHHKFEMEIPHEDQSSHYDHEKDKFAYLSMRDRIELGKRQVQQSQWGSKYDLNGNDSYEHTETCTVIKAPTPQVGITIPTLQPNLNLNHQ